MLLFVTRTYFLEKSIDENVRKRERGGTAGESNKHKDKKRGPRNERKTKREKESEQMKESYQKSEGERRGE